MHNLFFFFFFLSSQALVPNQKVICIKINYLNCHWMMLIQFFDLKGTRHKPVSYRHPSTGWVSSHLYLPSQNPKIFPLRLDHDPFKHGLSRPRLFVVNPQGFTHRRILKLRWLMQKHQVRCLRDHNFQQRLFKPLVFSFFSVFFIS